MTPERFEKLKTVLRQRQPDLTVFADGVHKAHNVSAILRTCDAVGIEAMHAVAADGDIPRHHMMSGGSRRWVDLEIHRSTAHGMQALRDDGWTLAVADARSGALDYRDVDYTRRIAIVLGAELGGPTRYAREHADIALAIPMHGLVESLNVSVAAAVILFEAERQRRRAGLYDQCRLPADRFRRKIFEWAHPGIASRCREKHIDYPALTAEGDLAENPF
ncbi:MAG: TrmH family RNA methyltransferase [Gammaproteobacteria bacterium]|jgi:tRNA (guanosine-2'-O-)-methyltransferase